MFEQDRNSCEIEYPELKNKYYLSGISAQHFISRGARGDSENLTAIIKKKKKKIIYKIDCGLQCVRDGVRDDIC